MRFGKGNKLGKGRPVGSKNKNYLDANHWLSRADELFQSAQDDDRKLSITKWATELIMAKVPALPATPGDSLSNALESQAIIKALEHDAAHATADAPSDK